MSEVEGRVSSDPEVADLLGLTPLPAEERDFGRPPYRPPLSVELEQKVRAGLRMNRLTQAMLARRVGATQKHVSRVLNGYDDGSIPFWDALLREAWRAREDGEKGNQPKTAPARGLSSPDTASGSYE